MEEDSLVFMLIVHEGKDTVQFGCQHQIREPQLTKTLSYLFTEIPSNRLSLANEIELTEVLTMAERSTLGGHPPNST